MRDIEDASFEVLGSGRDRSPAERSGCSGKQVFKSRLTQSPADGPFPRDFAIPDPAPIIMRPDPGERLDVFANGPAASPDVPGGLPSFATAAALTVCALAAAAFWMTGGQALLRAPPAQLQAQGPALTAPSLPETTPAATIVDPSLLSEPITTASVPSGPNVAPAAKMPATESSGSVIDVRSRPARIERGGSILMIRPRSE